VNDTRRVNVLDRFHQLQGNHSSKQEQHENIQAGISQKTS
jgi:hypothetical protein